MQGSEDLIGQRVVVNPLLSCGDCRACAEGRPNICPTWRLLGLDDVAGAFAEYVVVPARNVSGIPVGVDDRRAVLTEPLANAVHILGMLPAEGAQRGAILGGGTLGALIFSVAQQWGLDIVAVVEPNPARAEALRTLGASNVIDPRVGSLPEGLDFVVDAVGRGVTREAAVRGVRKGGTVLLLGLDEGPTTLDFQDVVRREVRIQGSFAYTPEDFAMALAMLADGLVQLDAFTDVLPLEAGQAAFDRLASDPGDRLKILLTP